MACDGCAVSKNFMGDLDSLHKCFRGLGLCWPRGTLGWQQLGSTVKTPELVAAVCLFIKEKLKGGLRKTPCSQGETDLGEVFRTDAKCEDARIVLGGWMTYGGVKSSEAPWFFVEVLPHQAPWFFRGDCKESTWASTSAELLASLIAIKLFQVEKLSGHGQKGPCR